MEVMILCAGAADKSFSGPKADRPLRTKGKRQMQKIGAFLGQNGLRPTRVFVSNEVRSRVSAEKALKAAGWTVEGIEVSDDLSRGHLPDLSAYQKALLVASAPVMRRLVQTCGISTGCSTIDGLKAGVLLEVTDAPGQDPAVRRTAAKELPDHFPYPAPDGPERRERPAYYYTQSAVIPFRQSLNGVEILIIRSSSGRHWTLPKGIVEPGLNPGESALVEAREEAGLEGTIEPASLGSYAYAKWGATCQVTVFAMKVTNVLPETIWEERHRHRSWVSPADAASLLNQSAIRPMLLGL